MQSVSHKKDPESRVPNIAIGVVILALAMLIFTREQISIAAVNGWWTDEIYSMNATDPHLTFAEAFRKYMVTDSNPPLYYVCLFWTRHWISLPSGDERVGATLLNVIAILLASATVIGVSWRPRVAALGFAGISAFLLSGPLLEYAPEARCYVLGFSIIFVASWLTALAIEFPRQHPHWAYFALLGVLGALDHPFAALMCGSLAAGLLTLAFIGSRRDLAIPGLALGISASCTVAIWLALVSGSMKYEVWNEFTVANLMAAVWEVRQLEIGGRAALAALFVLFLCAFVNRPTRPMVIAFGTAFILFIVLPIVASFKSPLIVGRYWLMSGPALIVLVVFLARAGVLEGITTRWRLKPLVIGFGSMCFLVSSSATGFINARSKTENKPIWKGAAIVAPLIQDCPEGSIHVPSSASGEYAWTAHAPAALFVDASAPETGWLTISKAVCPVIGWAEHVRKGNDFLTTAPDEDLLKLLKIDADPAQVVIRRHSSGYVVLRRNP